MDQVSLLEAFAMITNVIMALGWVTAILLGGLFLSILFLIFNDLFRAARVVCILNAIFRRYGRPTIEFLGPHWWKVVFDITITGTSYSYYGITINNYTGKLGRTRYRKS